MSNMSNDKNKTCVNIIGKYKKTKKNYTALR